jgi:hypothetical protein
MRSLCSFLLLLSLAAEGSRCFEQRIRRSRATHVSGGAMRRTVPLSVSAYAKADPVDNDVLLKDPTEVCLL